LTLQTGTRLGSYEILAPLGAGGMGEVYRARDAKLDRDVAVKVLPASIANDPDALARFEREAKAVAALSHPNILAIHDFGSQDGVAYAVMELLEGETLRGKIDSGPIPVRQATDYGLQIVKGLAAAHSRGIVHRDLKPDNVFVTRDGHLKILDFGLAKRVDDARPGEATSAPTGTGHTAPGTVMGTMGYMSPEQLRGLPVDHRSDIFSFGALLYELLSGRKAFKRDSASDTIAAVLKEEPPELTGSGRAISPALDHVVRHCLEKNADDRFQSAKDVAFALSEASGASTLTSGASAAVPAPQDRNKRRVAIAAAILLVVLAAGVLLSRRGASRTSGASSGTGAVARVAVLPFENLGPPEDDYFADGIADEIRGKLTSLPGVQVIARGSSTPYKKTNKTPRQIAEELNVEYLLTATVRSDKSGGAARVQVRPELVDVSQRDTPTSKWQQTFDAPMTDVFRVQSDIATQVAQALGVALGATQQQHLEDRPTENMGAYEAFLKGEETASVLARTDAPTLRKAVGFYERAVQLDPGFARAWAMLSMSRSLLYANGIPTPELKEQARQAAEKAVALAPDSRWGVMAQANFQRLVELNSTAALEVLDRVRNQIPGNADLLRMVGTNEVNLGRFEAGLQHLRAAQSLDPRSVTILQQLARALLAERQYVEARQIVDLGLALSPGNLSLLKSRAVTYLGEGDLEGARASIAETGKNVDPRVLTTFLATTNDLGWVLTDAQKQLLLTLTPADFDGDATSLALCLMQQYWWKGDVAGARQWAEKARVGLEEQIRGVPNDDQRHALLGSVLAYLGRTEDSIREGRRALELSSKGSFDDPYNLGLLARSYAVLGQPDQATEVLEKLLKTPDFVSAHWLAIDPNFAPLRGNPRFQKLIGKG
jgi:TolB-like protein/tetratricopeptide (TPR) repeat protein